MCGSLPFRWSREREAGEGARPMGICTQTALPALQLLLAEAERTVVLQYLRALMQGRLVCRGADERTQAAERLRHDAAQLKELFLGLVRAYWEGRRSRIGWEPRAAGNPAPMSSGPGGERSLRASAARAEGAAQPPRSHAAWPRGGRPEAKISRREVRGRGQGREEEPGTARAGLRRHAWRYSCSEDHVSALLDLRGDVSREHRQAALSSLQAGPPPSPSAGRRALFSLVPTPTPSLSSCLPSGPCS